MSQFEEDGTYQVKNAVFEGDVDKVYKLALSYRDLQEKQGLVGAVLRATKGKRIAGKLAGLTHEVVVGNVVLADQERESGLLETNFPEDRVDGLVDDVLDGEVFVQPNPVVW